MKARICTFAYVAAAGAAFLAWGASALAGVNDVKVTTDTSIDCSSIQSIARDLYKNYKSDQEKAIATWYFVRRMHFHWPHIPTWNSIDLINSYGFALCGHQSTMLCQIANAGGLKARTMHLPGHVIAEINYDGAWHMFDCQVGWYALNRKGKVASCAEMKADPTLVTDAVKENRASKPYFQCRDDPRGGTNYAAKARAGRIVPPPKNRLIVNLRRGESITRLWGNESKPWFPLKNDRGFVSPRHSCTGQGIDTNDPVNWPYWRTYAKVSRRDGDRVIYGIKRYYGNGRMVYQPDLATEAFTKGLAKDGAINVAQTGNGRAGPKLHPAEAGKPASVTFEIHCPYIATDAWLDAKALRKGADDVLAIHARPGNRGGWKEIYRADETGRFAINKLPLKEHAWQQHKFLVRLEMRAGAAPTDVGLGWLRITTVFMNNMYALPYFKPGKNTIKLTAAEGTDLKKNKLTLEYAWEEQGKEKTLTKTITKLPFQTTVEVGGKELPRMKHVKLSVAP